jgi:hypothetical protein
MPQQLTTNPTLVRICSVPVRKGTQPVFIVQWLALAKGAQPWGVHVGRHFVCLGNLQIIPIRPELPLLPTVPYINYRCLISQIHSPYHPVLSSPHWVTPFQKPWSAPVGSLGWQAVSFHISSLSWTQQLLVPLSWLCDLISSWSCGPLSRVIFLDLSAALAFYCLSF